ncbi:restriction endonuclease subunit S [Rhizobium sp. SAFR-030]|uniref:restriction endonuclease subunit S n=1 Tax=Rhizobium sp. SAFR-030 TaxID=3387277 RepID=UPI003F7E73C4
MVEWRETTWGAEISLEYGKGIRGYADAVGPYRVFGSNGPVGWTNEPLAPGPGVILGRKGAYRGVQFSKEPFFVIDTAYYVVPKSEMDMRWLYYSIIYHKLGEIDDGSPIPSTTRAAVYVRDLSVPELAEQEAIASVLGALDDKIELNRRMNETLEAMARAIFKDWFVDFGPTRAKIEGRARYLAQDIWSLFPDLLDDEGKPEGWTTSTIGQEVEVVGGSTPSTKEAAFWGGDISWATPKDLSSLSTPVLLSTERQITEAGLAQIGSGLLPVGTVLLSSRAPIGYMAIAQMPVAVNQGFIAMICKKRLSNVFVWLWTQANMETVHQNANGSTFQEISKANFRPIEVTIATPEILRAFDETARPLFDRIVANDRENRTLATTRDFLLPKLMSGEVRVGDAASFI